MTKYVSTFLILLIMGLGGVLRSYQLNAPLADWHSWRQADTASVAREYLKHGIKLTLPTYHDLSSIPSGLDNPQGYRFVEFPLVSALHATLARTFPALSLVAWGRILSIISSTLTVGVIYLLMRHVSTKVSALISAFVYATLPYNIFYGRVILPEPHLVLFMLISLFAFVKYYDTTKSKFLLSYLVCLSLAILQKPTALIILIPIALYVFITGKIKIKPVLVIALTSSLALVPYALWRQYLHAFPEGVPANTWLFNGNGIRFKGAWLRWLFGDRLGRLILGYLGLIPFTVGLIALGRNNKETAVVGGMGLASLVYLAVIATGNVQHDYYQILIIPAVSMMIGVGVDFVLRQQNRFGKKLYQLTVLTCSYLVALALGWYEVRGYFNINNPAIVRAGQAVDMLTPPDALVIAPYQGDTAFLFQTNRRGWPIGGAIAQKINLGATYYVTTTRDTEYQELKAKYSIIKETDDYSIINLTH